MFCVSNDGVKLRRSTKTKHSPGIRTIADFTSCRTKPSSLLIYFLQFLPQTVTGRPIPHPPVASQSFGRCGSSSTSVKRWNGEAEMRGTQETNRCHGGHRFVTLTRGAGTKIYGCFVVSFPTPPTKKKGPLSECLPILLVGNTYEEKIFSL